MPVDTEQKHHFDRSEHQYPRDAVIAPPVHTMLELEGVLGALAPVPTSRQVIDLGAGTGRLSIALARAGYRVLAVDISEQSLAVLATIADELDLEGVTVSTSLPADGRFGAVVGADILHHVDLEDILPRIHALLHAGDRIVFTEPGGMHPSWYAWFALTGQLRVERRIVACNLRTLPRALERHGFRDVRVTGVGLLPRPFFRRSVTACKIHDRCGNLPVARWIAYRYLVEATR